MAEPFIWLPIGARQFRCFYGLQEYTELERICGVGTGEIRRRTGQGRYGYREHEVYPEVAEYRVTELWEIVRQGIIGGHMMAQDGVEQKIDGSYHAEYTVKPFYFGMQDGRAALTKLWADAYSVIGKLTEGFDPPKKAEPAESRPTRKRSSTRRKSGPTAS